MRNKEQKGNCVGIIIFASMVVGGGIAIDRHFVDKNGVDSGETFVSNTPIKVDSDSIVSPDCTIPAGETISGTKWKADYIGDGSLGRPRVFLESPTCSGWTNNNKDLMRRLVEIKQPKTTFRARDGRK